MLNRILLLIRSTQSTIWILTKTWPPESAVLQSAYSGALYHANT
jgi:hypothetical protein